MSFNVSTTLGMRLSLALLVMMLAGACVGLAGEPDIVATLPAQQPGPELPQPDEEQESASAQTAGAEDADLALGAQVYVENNCARCHGEGGAGDGEFVTSGQIASIPDFTDPATIEGKTVADYFRVITEGNLETLMPPWEGTLTELERWSVAAYTFAMAGGDSETAVAVAPVGPAERPDGGDSAAVDNPHDDVVASADGEAVEFSNGAINGQLTNGTAGFDVPEGTEITLSMLDMQMNEELFTATTNADGSFTFDDVPLRDDRGYVASVFYEGQRYTTEIVMGRPQDQPGAFDITLFEVTDDPSAIEVVSVFMQVDEYTDVHTVIELVTFVNTSDRIFINIDEGVSVGASLPDGATVMAEAIEPGRYSVGADGTLFDTTPVSPGAEHRVHIVYTLPPESQVPMTRSYLYPYNGMVEVYVGADDMSLDGWGFSSVGSQATDTVTYHGFTSLVELAANEPLAFDLMNDSPGEVVAAATNANDGTTAAADNGSSNDNLPLSAALMVLGLIMVGVAVFNLWPKRGKGNTASTENANSEMDLIMQQITALDDRFAAKEIDAATYELERGQLKAKLASLMQSAAVSGD